MKARDSPRECPIFVVGINEGKFFGQDGVEEGLKLIERVAEHDPNYQLLFSISERDLKDIEEQYPVKDKRLTPCRELESERNCEFISFVQAGVLDQRPRRALGRSLRTTQHHVAFQLWGNSREAIKVWRYGYLRYVRERYKDAERYKFWISRFPAAGSAFFNDRAEVIAIRLLEHTLAEHSRGQHGTQIVIVSNDLYGLVVNHLRALLGDDAKAKYGDTDFSKTLRERATYLCRELPDLTPFLVFVYAGLPMVVLHFFYLAGEYYFNQYRARVSQVETRD